MSSMDTQTAINIFWITLAVFSILVGVILYKEYRDLTKTMERLKSSDALEDGVSFGRTNRAYPSSPVDNNNSDSSGVYNSLHNKSVD